MEETNSLPDYNYDSFVPEKFEPWMRFDQSPPLGERGPNSTLYTLDEEKILLSDIWGDSLYTVVEFGSFT